MKNNSSSVSVKLPLKKRPIKGSLIYLILLIIISIGIGFLYYKYIYSVRLAYLAIPIVFIAGILINIKNMISIFDFIFNTYTVKTVVCEDVKYKYDKKNNVSDKFSDVYFIDYKSKENINYRFNYRTNFKKGNAYKIIIGKLSKKYISISR